MHSSQLRHFWGVYHNHFRETLRLSFPVIIAQLGHTLMGLIDNVMVGQLSYVHLSAASLANGNFFILTIFGLGITYAITPLVAEADGAGTPARAAAFLRQGLLVGGGAALVFGLLVWISADLLPLMNQPEADVRLARSYSRILAVSALPMLLFLVFKQFADGLSVTRAAMYVTLAGLAFNAFANWLLIFGNWGFPRLELDGAGYATLSARVLMMLLMGGYVLRARRFRPYRLSGSRQHAGGEAVRSILRIGIPSGLQYFFEMGAFIGAGILIGWMENGSANRAAHQVAMSMASITYMVVTGFAAGATIRVGHALGQRNAEQMRRAGLAGMWLAAAFMLLAAVALIFGRQLFTRLYVSEPEVQRIAASLLIFAALFQLFDGLQAVGASVLRGIQDVRIPTVITFVAYWLIALPVGGLLGFTFGLGVYGLWYGFVISLIFAAVALVWRFQSITQHWMQSGIPAAAAQ